MSTITFSPAYDARPLRVVRPARPATRPTAGPGELRLTRRGRLVVFAAALIVAFAVAFVLAGGSSASDSSAVIEPSATERIVVEPGQTLWAIAADHAADGEVRETVHAIERLNGLESPMLVAGQELFVPASND